MQSRTLQIQTDSEHLINVNITGDEFNTPVVVLHGGPGSKSKSKHIKDFDFTKVFTIQIDQRGCGESAPLGSIIHNTTDDLIDDIELVRKELNIVKWIVAGGSWGSTLALLYSQKYPERVAGLYLNSIFLARKSEQDWTFNRDGVARFFPDLYEKIDAMKKEFGIPDIEPMVYINDVLKTGSLEEQQRVVSCVESWEGNLLSLDSELKIIPSEMVTKEDIASTRICVHYDVNNYFLEDNQILNDMEKIRNIPTVMLHGRYDVLCLPEQAYEVSKRFDDCTLEFIVNDGHKLGANARIVGRYLFDLLLTKIEY